MGAANTVRTKNDRELAGDEPCRCTTFGLGVDGFAECPQIGPNNCEFALPFGYAFLCRYAGKNAATGDIRTPPSMITEGGNARST